MLLDASDGGVFSTVVPDPVVTGIVWAGILLPVAGLALLVAARVRVKLWLPGLDSNQEPIG